MPKVSRTKFKQDVQSRIQSSSRRWSDWKKQGETIGFIHPVIGLWERWIHGSVPSIEEGDRGAEVRRRRLNCCGTKREEVPNSGCPLCRLRDFAIQKKEEGADGSEIILEAGSGKDRVIFDLNDLAGEGDWRTDIKAKQEIAFLWIDPSKLEGAVEMKNSAEIITGPQTLGERIIDVIDEQVSRRGEIHGNIELPEGFDELKFKKGKLCLETEDETIEWDPYPIKLKYNKEAKPERKYDADKMDRDLCALSPDVAQIMLASEEELDTDFERMCSPTEPEKQLEIIRSVWESRSVTFEEFKDYYTGCVGKLTDGGNGKPIEPDVGASIFCPHCGFKNRQEAKFCQGCGGKVQAEIEKKDAGNKDAGKKDAGKKDVGKGEIRCSDCGEIVMPMKPSNRCPECGEKIKMENDVPY